MSAEEKNTWAFGIVAFVAYGTYLLLVFRASADSPLVDVAYAGPILGTIAGAILGGIVSGIAIGMSPSQMREKKDQRDREIYRLGEYIGNTFVVVGAASAMVLAIAEVDHFWIANAIYLAFVLYVLASAATRLVSYRRGFGPW
jgi:hypothetical protein